MHRDSPDIFFTHPHTNHNLYLFSCHSDLVPNLVSQQLANIFQPNICSHSVHPSTNIPSTLINVQSHSLHGHQLRVSPFVWSFNCVHVWGHLHCWLPERHIWKTAITGMLVVLPGFFFRRSSIVIFYMLINNYVCEWPTIVIYFSTVMYMNSPIACEFLFTIYEQEYRCS